MASQLLKRPLYNGKYNVIHNPDAKGSAPRYKVVDDLDADKPKILEKPTGVTTILGKTLAKDLGPWMLDMMADALKGKLPLITLADIEEAKGASGRRRDSGASTGSEAHAMVEHFLRGTADDVAEHSKEATNAYEAFVKWFVDNKPVVINVEEVVYSQAFKYSGTYDAMLEVDGKVYLTDLKTTNASRKAPNGVYGEYFIQLGAYALAHEEQRKYEEANGGTQLRPIQGLMVISCKKNGKCDIVTETDIGLTLNDCMNMFKSTVNLFSFLKYTTTKLGGK